MARLLLSVLLVFTSGCANIAYYAQAVQGHLRVMAAAHPIPRLVADPATDPTLRKQLEQVTAIREFASRELALPDNGSYRSYAALGRLYVVWNVFAAPELSVAPKQWCLLFVGCVNYRGYYAKDEAEQFAAGLRTQGFDAYVGGVPAYSTLGLFSDPVLNTFLRFGEHEVARTIFHELAHQLVYAGGDSTFNESFATAVENEGVRRWLIHIGALDRLREFETQQQRKAQFRRLVENCRERLRSIYASPLLPEEKRRAKADAFAEMKREYAELKAGWGGYAGYDRWFGQPLNNATVSSVTLYTQWVPAFDALLEREGGSLPRFYLRVAELAHLSKPDRAAALAALMPATAKPLP